ncbi:MAG: O-antigen polymerase [bacterium]
MNLVILFLFIALGVLFGLDFIFGKKRFSFDQLLLSVWSFSIGISQLHLSRLEQPWTIKFWFILALFFGLFIVATKFFDKFWQKKIPLLGGEVVIKEKLFFWILLGLTLTSIACNYYIYQHFNTLPILSSNPDKLRFIINKEIFGLWEYLALLPRLIIPFTFVYLVMTKSKKVWPKVLAILNIIIGFGLLSLYSSRLTLVVAILMCYFIYLILRFKQFSFKKVIGASAVVVAVVLFISIAIPLFRQNITYRDYYKDVNEASYSYLYNLTELNIPKQYGWITPVYIIPSLNLQAMMRATSFFSWQNFYFGQYELSVFYPITKHFDPSFATGLVPWKAMFQYWWITATFMFDYWIDFGWVGIILGAIWWGALLSGIYWWAVRRPGFISAMLFAYFGFVTIMTIYTNYFIRQEFFMDLAVILMIGIILNWNNKYKLAKYTQLLSKILDIYLKKCYNKGVIFLK